MVVVASSALPPDGDNVWVHFGIRHSLATSPFWYFVKVGSPGRSVTAVYRRRACHRWPGAHTTSRSRDTLSAAPGQHRSSRYGAPKPLIRQEVPRWHTFTPPWQFHLGQVGVIGFR